VVYPRRVMTGSPGAGPPTVWTIGHGALSTEAIAATLRAAEVGVLVDIRRFPGSRRSPHLARERLAADLPALGIAYEWAGEALGGRRSPRPGPTRHTAWQDRAFRGYADHTDSAVFRSAVDELVARARAGERLVLMCAELDWRRCHRRLVADTLTVRGVAVVHLRVGRVPEPHEPHPDLRADAAGWPLWEAR
jgi:uncharacterized protein (DUF488 family)